MLYQARASHQNTLTGKWPLIALMPLAAALNSAAPATETDADPKQSADKEVTHRLKPAAEPAGYSVSAKACVAISVSAEDAAWRSS